MNRKKWKKAWDQALQLFMAFALAIAFYFFLLRFHTFKKTVRDMIQILMPFIYGGVMAYLLKTPCNFFDKVWEAYLPKKWKKHKTGLSVLLVMILAFLVIYTVLRTVIPQVANSIAVLVRVVPGQVTVFFDWITSYLKSDGVVQNYVRPIAEDIITKAANWANSDLLPHFQNIVTEMVNSIVGMVMNLVIGCVVCVYALCARKKFARQGKAVVYSILRPKQADAWMDEIRFADKTFDGFLSGQILDSAIVGLICYGFCLIMSLTRGFSNGILISLIIGITNIIPYFGPYIGAVPTTLLVAMSDPVGAVIFVLFIILLQQIDGNILAPKILSGSVGLSGFWVLFAVTVFSGIFGFIGVLIGVPVFAVIYDLIRKLVKKGLERNEKTELLELGEDEVPEKKSEKKDGKKSPGEHLEQHLEERIQRREKEEEKEVQQEAGQYDEAEQGGDTDETGITPGTSGRYRRTSGKRT